MSSIEVFSRLCLVLSGFARGFSKLIVAVRDVLLHHISSSAFCQRSVCLGPHSGTNQNEGKQDSREYKIGKADGHNAEKSAMQQARIPGLKGRRFQK